ncbi:MAG: hypothetical protein WEA31_08970, partial [Pirellulales bacterium]
MPQRHWQNQVHVNQFLYAILAEEKCAQADVQIAYYEFPHAITQTPHGWQVDCVGFGTRRRVLCKQIVDCTGGAEVVGLLLAAKSNTTPLEVPLTEIHDLLREHHAIVPGEV